MKKIVALLVFVMMFALASCAEEETTELDIGTINIGVIYNGKMDEEGTFANQHFAAFENAYSSAGAGGGQINQVQPFSTGGAPLFRQFNRVAEDSHIVAFALAEAYSLSVQHVDGRVEDHETTS